MKAIQTVLVANRGEIAVRVMRRVHWVFWRFRWCRPWGRARGCLMRCFYGVLQV